MELLVNIKSRVNSKDKIIRRVINDRNHIIIKDVVPMIDDIVMNGVLYPAELISKTTDLMHRRPLTYNHPIINNSEVSIDDPMASNMFGFGGWFDFAKKESGKYFVDAYIDEEIAKNSRNGINVLNKIEQLQNGSVKSIPVSIAVAAITQQESGKSKGKSYSRKVSDIAAYDHLAILPDHEIPAGKPEDGIGIIFNSSKILDNGIEVMHVDIDEHQSLPRKEYKVMSWISEKFKKINNSESEETSKDEIKALIKELLDEAMAGLKKSNQEAKEQLNNQSKKIDDLSEMLLNKEKQEFDSMRSELMLINNWSKSVVDGLSSDAVKELYASTIKSANISSSDNSAKDLTLSYYED